MKTGVELIAEERKRQVEVEGWSSEHDDKYMKGALSDAGACYAIASGELQMRGEALPPNPGLWPFHPSWWKPGDDPIRALVKAGALIAAEIDRIHRRESGQSIEQTQP